MPSRAQMTGPAIGTATARAIQLRARTACAGSFVLDRAWAAPTAGRDLRLGGRSWHEGRPRGALLAPVPDATSPTPAARRLRGLARLVVRPEVDDAPVLYLHDVAHRWSCGTPLLDTLRTRTNGTWRIPASTTRSTSIKRSCSRPRASRWFRKQRRTASRPWWLDAPGQPGPSTYSTSAFQYVSAVPADLAPPLRRKPCGPARRSPATSPTSGHRLARWR